ncbi:MAG: phosphatase PAP2 family protein [Ruminococcaceae bacterium]|nr:phosphatase PAP2 family protein [Oscillospiraceae bacterium]
MTKQKRIHPAVLIAVLFWLTALIAASVWDLDISLAIADESSVYGRILEVAGESPAILFTSFNFSLMMAHFLKRSDRSRLHLTLAALTFIGCVGTSVFTTVKIADYLADYGLVSGSMPTLIAVASALIIAALLLWNALRLSEASLVRYFDTACRCAYAAIATFVIIWIFKLCWGRVRFRQLDGDLTRFTPWYHPNGFNGYFSFPSGHTANATVIFSVTYYLRHLPERFSKWKPLILMVLVLWIAATAFSRVRVGAHYLSDVLFGAAITFAIVYFFKDKHD